MRKRADGASLPESRHSLDECVSSSKKCDDELPYEVVLPDDLSRERCLDTEDDIPSRGKMRIHMRKIFSLG